MLKDSEAAPKMATSLAPDSTYIKKNMCECKFEAIQFSFNVLIQAFSFDDGPCSD